MLEGVPILSIIIMLPLVGAIVTLLLGKHDKYAKWVAAGFYGAALVL